MTIVARQPLAGEQGKLSDLLSCCPWKCLFIMRKNMMMVKKKKTMMMMRMMKMLYKRLIVDSDDTEDDDKDGSKPSVMVVMVSLCVLVLTMPGMLPAIDIVNNIDRSSSSTSTRSLPTSWPTSWSSSRRAPWHC